MIVDYHPLTVSDLNSAAAYYNEQRPGLGNEFRAEVYATIERIRSNPFQFPPLERGIRRGFVRRFPILCCFALLKTRWLEY